MCDSVSQKTSRIELKVMAQTFSQICDRIGDALGKSSEQLLSENEHLNNMFSDLENHLVSIKNCYLKSECDGNSPTQFTHSKTPKVSQLWKTKYPGNSCWTSEVAKSEVLITGGDVLLDLVLSFPFCSVDETWPRQHVSEIKENDVSHFDSAMHFESNQFKQLIDVLDQLLEQKLMYLLHSGNLSTQKHEKALLDAFIPEVKQEKYANDISEHQLIVKAVEQLSVQEVSNILSNLGLDCDVKCFSTNSICGEKLLVFLESEGESMIEMHWIHKRMLCKAVRKMQGINVTPKKRANYKSPKKL